MKKLKTLLIISLLLAIFACEKSDDLSFNEITGTYTGTLTTDVSSKSSSQKITNTATAIVSMVGDKIEVHCYGENFDETVMLDIYRNNNEIMVCLTGTDFENMYGHMMGQGHMMGGNMGNTSTEWMRHMNNDHQQGAEHFGGFNMENHSFEYTFRMQNGDFHFEGVKK